MHTTTNESGFNPTSRRRFIKNTATAAVGASLALHNESTCAAPTTDDTIRVGLVGCGGRGRGAAVQALMADANTRLVALGDAFADQIESTLQVFKQNAGEVADRIDVPKQRCFVGFDAFQQVIDSDVDVVLLATPPHFRPQHLQACIDAGKHVFAEKPIAVDAMGVNKVREACQSAQERGLSVVSGLCWRYDARVRATMKQVHDGTVGRMTALRSAYNSSRPGKVWPMRRQDGWEDMEWQMRNWYWFTWLSGDHIVEQAIHSLDKAAWALDDVPPESATSLGGLQSRQGPELGTIFDHHAVIYQHAGGLKHFHYCRQQNGCANDISTEIIGSEGVCDVEKGIIRDEQGNVKWKYSGPKGQQMHQAEHDELFDSIRTGKPLNNGEYMCHSTMLAILGRMASYTGRKIKWDQAIHSTEDLSPPSYDWTVKLAVPPVATPGV